MKGFFSRVRGSAVVLVFVVIIFHGAVFADTVSGTSANWAGYIAQSGTYTAVSGSWVMPELAYSSTLASNATWVGIGGKSSSDLIQAGVYEIANADGATYQAWYELLPDNSVPIDLAVHPGDHISVAILETTQDTWNIVITNTTTNKQFAKTVSYHSSRSSAEWIQERPLIDGALVQLSGYTPVTFTGATAVQDGTRLTLSQMDAHIINLLDSPTNTALAVPGNITTDGTGFTVYRTSAVASAQNTIAPSPLPEEFVTPPYLLRRTGHIIVPWIPGIQWVIHFGQ